MTIELRAGAFRVPTERPEADGTLAWDATTVVVVQACSGGVTGTGWTYAAAAAAGVVEELLAPAIDADATADDPEAAAEAMSRALRNAGRPGIGATAMSAVDIALWDLRARREGMPLSRMLGAIRPSIPVYGSGGFTTEDDDALAAQLDAWLDVGVGAVKIKIAEDRGRRIDRDLERVALVRDRVGRDIGVFVDANGGYDLAQAIEIGRELDALGVAWFEEPVSSDDPDGLARVRDAVRADVAAGEYVWRPADAVPLLAGAVDCLQIDVTRCGGITVWPEIARMARAAGLEVSGHCAPQLAVHIGAATVGLRHLEWFRDHERVDAILFGGTLPVVDGCLTPTDAVGHGMTLSDRAERYRIR